MLKVFITWMLVHVVLSRGVDWREFESRDKPEVRSQTPLDSRRGNPTWTSKMAWGTVWALDLASCQNVKAELI